MDTSDIHDRSLEDPTRILVVRFSSIGDIVLTTPVLRGLKQQLEGPVEIHYLTKRPYATIVESNPHVDVVISIDERVSEVASYLRETRFDYLIDLHNNLRSRQVKRLVKALAFTLDKRNIAKWVYVQTKREWLPVGHIVARYLDTVKALGVVDDGRGLDFPVPEEKQVSLAQLPEAFQRGYIAFAIGGTTPGKVLPTAKIIDLCSRINRPVLLLGGPDDVASAEEIGSALKERVFNACGRFSLHQSASLLAQAEAVISHDTGLMHIAAALKKKTISLWLATTPEIGMAPWRPGEGSEMVEADCRKRPTSKLGNRGYDDGCVYNIDLDRIAALANASVPA